jgi:large subunit ribosomal protein L35
MPKQKTKRAATKRLKMSATGKFLQSRAGKGHLNCSKSRKRKRNLRGMKVMSAGDAAKAKTMLATYRR